MATVYHYNTEGGELFKGGVQVLTGVKVDFLGELLDPDNLSIVTEVSMQNSEVVQFFMSFDDVVSWFYFGKGIGNMTIKGMLLTSDKGTPGLPILLNDVMSKTRGQMVQVSIGNAVFSCVLTNFSVSLAQDPSPVVEYMLNLSIVNHFLPGRKYEDVPCDYNPRFE